VRETGSFPTLTGSEPEPWDRLRELIAERRAEEILPFLASLAPGEPARAIDRLGEDDRNALFTLLPPDEAAGVLDSLPDAEAAGLIEDLPAADAAAIVSELPSDGQADLLGRIEEGDAEAILERMGTARATVARRLLSYEPHTAGGLMMEEYLAYPEAGSVGDVVADLRAHGERYADYNVQYAYVTTVDGRLAGVLRVRDLLLSPETRPLREIMLGDPLRVFDTTALEDLKRFSTSTPCSASRSRMPTGAWSGWCAGRRSRRRCARVLPASTSRSAAWSARRSCGPCRWARDPPDGCPGSRSTSCSTSSPRA